MNGRDENKTALRSSSNDRQKCSGLGDLEARKKEKPPALLLGEGLATQEAAYDALARIAVEALEKANKKSKKRVVIGLAGGPGSGKSTAAAAVVERINGLWRERRKSGENGEEGEEIAVALPMDGYHLTKAQLAASVVPTPSEMLARRGAHWTFDAKAFVKTVREVAADDNKITVLAPSFDHGVGDPVAGGIKVAPWHRLVLVEGNYLLLPLQPWSQLVGEGAEENPATSSSSSSPPPFDQTWFLDVALDEAMERVRRRQVAAGVITEEASKARIEGNDRPNAETVAATKKRADVVVRGDLPLSSAAAVEE